MILVLAHQIFSVLSVTMKFEARDRRRISELQLVSRCRSREKQFADKKEGSSL